MTLESGWPLLLLIPLLAWIAREWRHTPRRLGLLVKALALASVCLALCRPQWRIAETYAAVAILSDASASIPDEERGAQETYLRRARAARRGHTLRELEFGKLPVRQLRDREASSSTNLEAALRNALGALPANRVPRLVLISDGLASEGAVERAVHQAWSRNVPIDTYALAGRAVPSLHLGGMRMPSQAHVGEGFPIEFEIESLAPAHASLDLRADGQLIGSERLALQAGRNTVAARAKIDSPGASLVEGVLTTSAGERVQFAGAVAIQEPRALLLSSDSGEQDAPLAGVLTRAGFKIERAQSAAMLADTAVLDYDLVICSNEDFEAWPDSVKERLAGFVRSGGGFLLIAGEKNLYHERSADKPDALQSMLPATLAPPRTPEGTAVVLVVDKSSSMEGKKMQLARQSALGVVENLRAIDSVGVLAFDNSFEWAAPLRRNETPEETKRMISGIVADGGTQIAPALGEAYRIIQPREAAYKHILLLTDGISEEGDSIALAREAATNEVTISTIGLGQDVNRSYLERVARGAEGQSYFLIDVSALEQIVLKDVMEHTGTSVTEREFVPYAERDFEILANLDLTEPGPLLGWVKFEAKPSADTILLAADEDPLFARWQFGLGRAAVFASDAKDRWAANWVAWKGFDTFWSNALRDLLPRAARIAVQTEYDASRDEVVARFSPSDEGKGTELPDLYALGPDGYRHVARPKPSGDGFEARFPAEGLYGLFRIRPAARTRAFPETAYYRQNSEMSRYGSDSQLLKTIADATGGRTNPAPEDLFATESRSAERWMELWPALLGLAIFLNLVELIARKGWLPALGRWA
ncbi:MAG: VWA domain-containing protein [Bryobacterales bacterium]|nr:VWA domain-containing protein [Bryobacterales bacterium]